MSMLAVGGDLWTWLTAMLAPAESSTMISHSGCGQLDDMDMMQNCRQRRRARAVYCVERSGDDICVTAMRCDGATRRAAAGRQGSAA